MNTNAQTMAWFMDAYSARQGYTPAIVTGKPLALGGQPGREPATGRGVIYVLEAYAAEHGLDLVGLPIVVQGFGNVGSWAAREAAQRGCRIVGVSDRFGGVYHERGLDVAELLEHASGGGSVLEYKGEHEEVSNEELLVSPCSVLVPAALDEQLHQDNAGDIQATVVIEAANYPTTPGADKILFDRGVTVIPDILANAGGVTGSYFEWTRNIQQMPWTEERFNDALRDYMVRAYDATSQFAKAEGCTLRQAAFAIGIQRVASAVRMRGYV
jgi:glutamate dehydrogenase (NAD(P)+)